MAATAQDASAPLRGPDKKDEDRDEDSKHPIDLCLHAALPAIAFGRIVHKAALLHWPSKDNVSSHADCCCS